MEKELRIYLKPVDFSVTKPFVFDPNLYSVVIDESTRMLYVYREVIGRVKVLGVPLENLLMYGVFENG